MKKILVSLLCSEKFLELRRKVSHIVFGVTILCAYFDQWLWSLNQALLFRLLLVIVYMILTNISFKTKTLRYLSELARNLFERKDTLFSGIGGLTLLIGCYLPIWMEFDLVSTVVIIVTLSVGDGCATLIGKYLDVFKIKISTSRSLSGSLGALLCSLFVIQCIVPLDVYLVSACILGIGIELMVGLTPEKINKYIVRYSLDNICIPIGMIMYFILIS